MFVLGTNVVSELRRPKHADPRVWAWANAVPVAQMFLSVVTLIELEAGVLRKERSDAAQGALLRAWFQDHVLGRFDARILPIDTAVARRCAQLQVPTPRAQADAVIAATAFVHGMTVVARNEADFEGTGVALLNPWR